MSKILKNGGLDQYGAEPFEQQQFGTAGVEGVNSKSHTITVGLVQVYYRDHVVRDTVALSTATATVPVLRHCVKQMSMPHLSLDKTILVFWQIL